MKNKFCVLTCQLLYLDIKMIYRPTQFNIVVNIITHFGKWNEFPLFTREEVYPTPYILGQVWKGLRTVRDLCLPAKGRKQTQEKMPFKSAWKLSVVHPKEADQIVSRVFRPIISTISKWLKTDTWRSDVFFP